MMMEAATFPAQAPAAAGRIPGNKGIWVGITCEFVEFALMFVVYFVARYNYPDAFRSGPEQIWTTGGAINTVLMVTSSFFIACAVASMKQGNPQRSRLWMVAAIVTALGYPVVKLLEIDWNLAHGIDGRAGIFYTVYYYLTFNHMVHACWGILGMGWVLARMSMNAYTPEQHDGLEAMASYWHATDIIWLAIFPLFYVLA
ncbi:MAG TPA: cytochrome c oxidase subunit 3 family protein [Noviherbaspirillum sp.]|uniref:cytochrome c oxidase subunit 3 family protein n=1 Tax=Noviherbaspirillum sp. TaxID=1926288 RepID=UPI002D3647DA|nr:cytochrome c oxidase subunit 3 family protein [Noviherbaspirillum sp.]HYD95760.1 cytochrome c oxidase subunit 3 family protein [Noviherbaspirillum sp.]